MNVSQDIQENFLKTRYTCPHRSLINLSPPPRPPHLPLVLGHVPLKKRLTHHYKCKAFYFLAFKPTFLKYPLIVLVKALFLS